MPEIAPQSVAAAQGSNPFATRFTRPGAVLFEFLNGQSVASLLERLAAQDWRGAIVGPHGSGKSTLLAALLAELETRGHTALVYRLRAGERSLHPSPAAEAARLQPKLIVVDGFEQLGWLARWRLVRMCRQRRAGLLVTSHTRVRLPTLISVEPSLETVSRVVARLLGSPLSDEWIAAVSRSFHERQGNVREALFDLYDLYESQRSRPARSKDSAPADC